MFTMENDSGVSCLNGVHQLLNGNEEDLGLEKT